MGRWGGGIPDFGMELISDLFHLKCRYTRVTMATNVTSGPFVNEKGQLDLTLAREEDSMFYLCTGVDVAGASASQLFRVEITVEGELTYLIL